MVVLNNCIKLLPFSVYTLKKQHEVVWTEVCGLTNSKQHLASWKNSWICGPVAYIYIYCWFYSIEVAVAHYMVSSSEEFGDSDFE